MDYRSARSLPDSKDTPSLVLITGAGAGSPAPHAWEEVTYNNSEELVGFNSGTTTNTPAYDVRELTPASNPKYGFIVHRGFDYVAYIPVADAASVDIYDETGLVLADADKLLFDGTTGVEAAEDTPGIVDISLIPAHTDQMGAVTILEQYFAGRKHFQGNVVIGSTSGPILTTSNDGVTQKHSADIPGFNISTLYRPGSILFGIGSYNSGSGDFEGYPSYGIYHDTVLYTGGTGTLIEGSEVKGGIVTTLGDGLATGESVLAGGVDVALGPTIGDYTVLTLLVPDGVTQLHAAIKLEALGGSAVNTVVGRLFDPATAAPVPNSYFDIHYGMMGHATGNVTVLRTGVGGPHTISLIMNSSEAVAYNIEANGTRLQYLKVSN